MNKLRAHMLGAVSALVLADATSAMAQSAVSPAGSAPDATLDEVVVTARKRAEDINKVPISITAFSGEALQKANINTFADLANNTPGLSFGSVPGGAASNIVIRGLAPGNKTAGIGTEANVGIFIDGIFQTSRNSVTNIDLIDIGQLEVVKGPQSAAFGRSTFGGAIVVQTRAPSHTFAGDASVTIGSDDDYRVRASVSGPIYKDVVFGRLGLDYSTFDGSVQNPAGGNDGGYDHKGLTGTIEAHPFEHFTATLSGYLSDARDEIYGTSIVPYTSNNCGAYNATTGANLGFCGSLPVPSRSGYVPPYSNLANTGLSTTLPDSRNLNGQLALNLQYDADWFSVISVTGANYGKNDSRDDYDGTASGDLYGVCPLVAGAPTAACIANPARYVTANSVLRTIDSERFVSEELRVQSKDGARFRWSFGGYYDNASIHETGVSGVSVTSGTPLARVGSTISALGAETGLTEALIQVEQPIHARASQANTEIVPDVNSSLVTNEVQTSQNKTYAIFGSMGYAFTDKFRVNFEGRWNHESKENNQLLYFFAPGVGLQQRTFSIFTPRFTAEYQFTPEIFLYASAARGAHSGGFNPIGLGALPSEYFFDQETNWTYEGGAKGRFLDNRLLLTAAYYHTDWSNVQVQSRTQNVIATSFGPAGIIANAGNITLNGFEATADYRVMPWLTIGGNMSYNDSSFDRGSYDAGKLAICGAPTNAAPATQACNFIPVTFATGVVNEPSIAGNSPANTPKLQFNVHAVLTGEFAPGWTWSGRADFNHADKEYTDNLNLSTYGERNLLNLFFTVNHGKYGITAFMTNATDDRYISYVIAQPRVAYNFNQSPIERYIGDERRYGVTLNAKF